MVLAKDPGFWPQTEVEPVDALGRDDRERVERNEPEVRSHDAQRLVVPRIETAVRISDHVERERAAISPRGVVRQRLNLRVVQVAEVAE